MSPLLAAAAVDVRALAAVLVAGARAQASCLLLTWPTQLVRLAMDQLHQTGVRVQQLGVRGTFKLLAERGTQDQARSQEVSVLGGYLISPAVTATFRAGLAVVQPAREEMEAQATRPEVREPIRLATACQVVVDLVASMLSAAMSVVVVVV